MSIDHPSQLEALQATGKIVRMMLERMKEHVRPGVTTKELDEIGAEVMEKNGARSAPSTVYGFPGTSCISVNDEAVHGIPSVRILREGDLLKLDVTILKDGFMADAAETVAVGQIDDAKRRLNACARSAFQKSLLAARAGFRVMEIGRAVEREGKAARLLRPPRTRRTRDRAYNSRTALCAQFPGSPRSSNTPGRHGAHHRADHLGGHKLHRVG
jgi:methionyl aminopeptidase